MKTYFRTPEDDSLSLPDCEVFYADAGELTSEDGEPMDAGCYWWACFPGCLPDSEPNGPFGTQSEALADARDFE